MDHVTLDTTYGEGSNSKAFDISYLIMDAMSSYNIILGRLAINALKSIIFIMYLALKYLLLYGRVSIVGGNQLLAQECYQNSLAIERE